MNKEERLKRDELIAQLHNGGYTHKEIAEALEDNKLPRPGPHTIAVIISRLIGAGRCKKRESFGNEKRRIDRALVVKALNLRMRGEVSSEISRETGISIHTLKLLFQENGVRIGRKKELNIVVNSRGKEIK